MLDPERRRALLRVAREAVAAAAKDMPYAPESDDPELLRPAAVFVTLRKGGALRGCIGTIAAKEPLIRAVANMARAAAREDPRFARVHMAELPEITIEVSVLSPLRRVSGPEEIKVGRDGLVVKQGAQQGLLLPQVATEWGWDREEFLDETCLKAGLPPGSWRRGAEVYCFQAEVFGEGEMKEGE